MAGVDVRLSDSQTREHVEGSSVVAETAGIAVAAGRGRSSLGELALRHRVAKPEPCEPGCPTSYRAFHSMATGLREGRIGQVDLRGLRSRDMRVRISNLRSVRTAAAWREHGWVNFYTLDVGYSFIVEAARLAFPALPDNHLRALALQLVVDAAMIPIVFFVFSQWNIALGLIAAYLYSSNQVFFDLVSFPFYYYWDIPLTFVVLGAMLLAFRRPTETTGWLTLAGLALGFGVWLRGSWWPLSLFLCGVAASTPVFRRNWSFPSLPSRLLPHRKSYGRLWHGGN